MADDTISPATISNIERGVPHVGPDKVDILLKKLDLRLEQLPEIIMNEQKEIQKLDFRLVLIESMLDFGQWDQAKEKLENINLDDDHPLAPKLHYLKGKYCFEKGDFTKAERSYYNSIRLVKQREEDKSNIEAACFNELSVISYLQNDREQAVNFAESGLDVFVEDGDRKEMKHILMVNKAAFLYEQGRTEAAMQVVNEAWGDIPNITKTSVALHLYEIRTDLLRKMHQYEEAIQCDREGLEMARCNQSHQRASELWTSLGITYQELLRWEEAEECFQMAISIQGDFQFEHGIVSTYTYLGKLYVAQEKWNEAIEVLQKGIQKGEEINDALRLNAALFMMGDCYQKQGKVDEAIPITAVLWTWQLPTALRGRSTFPGS